MARKAFQLVKGVHVPGTKWLLVREIARGGMGVTWEVVKHPGIRGVMKMILPDLSTSAGYVRRFLEEVEILTKLNHPNIVQVFDFDMLDDGTPFFVMERLEGKTLGAAMVGSKGGVRVRKAFPARVAYEITRQTCEALYRAHSLQPRGVIHRDLKPDNIYIHHASYGGEPVIKLLDFGVAAFEQATRESGPVGTPRYMAPEQLRCEDITPKADLYAMGLVLYEMLVGRGPFDHLTISAQPHDRALILVNAHVNETPAPPSQFAPWIPKTIDSLLLSALDKDPDKRPVSAYAFVAKLYELQFVNDGTPREAVGANTTAPTLVKIIEDDAPESDPALSLPARSSLPKDTIREAPRTFGGEHTLEMTIDPFGNKRPKAAPAAIVHGGVDRNAPTRLSDKPAPRRAASSHDTVPMSSRELERPWKQSAPSAPSASPDATPLTSDMPARPSSEKLAAGGRKSQPKPPAERPEGALSWALRVLGVFAIICPFAILLGLKLGHMWRASVDKTAAASSPPADLAASSPPADLGTRPGELGASMPAVPTPTAPPAPPPAPPPPAVASTPLAAARAPGSPAPAGIAPAGSSVSVVASAPSAVPASAPSSRPRLPSVKPAGARPASSKPALADATDDGRDLLYVPLPPVKQP